MRVPVGLFPGCGWKRVGDFLRVLGPGGRSGPARGSRRRGGISPAKFEGTKIFYDFEKARSDDPHAGWRQTLHHHRDPEKVRPTRRLFWIATPYGAAKFVSRAPSPHMALGPSHVLWRNSPKPATSSWHRDAGEI